MTYCTKCGKQNPDTAKFCTSCGTALKIKTEQPSPPAIKQDTEYEKLFNAKASKKKNGWIIITVIAVLGLGTGAYFMFFNKKTGKEREKETAKTDSTIVTPPVVKQEMMTDSTAAYPAASETVPLNPGNSNQEITITQPEVDAVSDKLRNFYQCENDQDISCLLSQYSFPVSRYYQLNNVSYDDLHKLFTESFNEKLNYHHITIKWDLCTIQRIGDSYKAVLYADYEFVRTATPDETRNRSIQIIIFMNSSYHITTIYENQ